MQLQWSETQHASPAPQAHYNRTPGGVQIRWSALATGSLVGIASWATLYLLGAGVAWSVPAALAEAMPLARALLGIYGALAASLALAVASFVAAYSGGACSRANALLYGICLWSLSTITLVAVALLASCGFFASLSSEAAAIFDVGLAALGMSTVAQGTASPTGVLWAMFVTIVVSLVCALQGALSGGEQATASA